MAEQRLQPSAPRHHVGVEERHEVGAARRQTGVARRRGALAAIMAQHLNVAMHVREVGRLDSGRRTVVDHDDTQAAQGCHQSLQSRSVVPHRNNDGQITVRRAAGRPWMSNGRVEQCACKLRADRVVHLEPATVEHGLRGGRQPQQPGGRTAEQGRALAEHLDPAIHLHGEPVGQPRPRHVSIPSRSGTHLAIRCKHPSTISAKYSLALVGGRGGGIAEHAQLTHRGDTSTAHLGHQVGQRRAVAGQPFVDPDIASAKYVAIQRFRCGRRARRRSRRCMSTSSRRDPRTEAKPWRRPAPRHFRRVH